MDDWWLKWQQYIFSTEITINGKSGKTNTHVYELFSKIKKSKYPAISEHEEEISIPLQTLSLAIFDSILVHMMAILAPT